MILVDSNILIDLATRDPVWGAWSRDAFALAAESDLVAINPIIYAEASIGYDTAADFDSVLDDVGITRLALPYPAGYIAGQAFGKYRKRGGARPTPLPDFYIGAHALVDGMALLTRDRRHFGAYFPTVRLIAPEAG